jgi:hypothetical protein
MRIYASPAAAAAGDAFNIRPMLMPPARLIPTIIRRCPARLMQSISASIIAPAAFTGVLAEKLNGSSAGPHHHN